LAKFRINKNGGEMRKIIEGVRSRPFIIIAVVIAGLLVLGILGVGTWTILIRQRQIEAKLRAAATATAIARLLAKETPTSTPTPTVKPTLTPTTAPTPTPTPLVTPPLPTPWEEVPQTGFGGIGFALLASALAISLIILRKLRLG
jgi:hypothetical protein